MNTTIMIVLFLYLAIVFITGHLAGRREVKCEEGFYTGDREFGFWSTTMSACATDSSGWVFIGACGWAFVAGASVLWMVPGFIVGYGLNWFLLGPKLRRQGKKIGALSVIDFLNKRLDRDGNTIRIVGSIVVILFFIPYMASQLTAAGKTISTIVGWDYNTCLVSGAIFVVAYCFLGGYRSVIWTDTVQGTLMLIVLGVFPIYLIASSGGFTSFFTQVAAIDPILVSPGAGATGSALLGIIVGYLFYGAASIGQPHILQRFLSAKDSKTLRQGSIIATVWFNVMMVGSNIVGLAGRIRMPGIADPEYIFPAMVEASFHPIIAGIVVGAIFAAIQSTYSSLLLVAVQAIASDLTNSFRREPLSEAGAVKLGRMTMVLLGVVSILLAVANIDTVFLLVVYAWSVLGAAFGPLIMVLLLWPSSINKWGAIAGMVVGALVTSIWYSAGLGKIVFETCPGMIAAFAAIFIVSYLTRHIDKAPEKI